MRLYNLRQLVHTCKYDRKILQITSLHRLIYDNDDPMLFIKPVVVKQCMILIEEYK